MVAHALEAARAMAEAGIPVFCAYPDAASPTGFRLPRNWQSTTANPAYVDAWKTGMALCAVMGQGVDLVDVDPRNGGDPAALDGVLPDVLGEAASPSGGRHLFVASMGVRSRDGVLPGIDIKAGDRDGEGRGFAFIAPTVRKSKVTGEPAAYRWIEPLDLERLGGHADGGQLAALARQAHGSRKSRGGALFQQPAPRQLGDPVPYGQHHAALVSYAGWLRSLGLPLREAEALMLTRLGDLAQPPDADQPRYTEAEALAELHDVYGRYEAGGPQDAPGYEDDDFLAEIAARYTPVSWDEAWAAQPEAVEWLFEPMLERGTINALYARIGTGKSLLALEIAMRLARRGLTVVYVDDENR